MSMHTNILRTGVKRMGPDFLSMMPNDGTTGTWGNGHKLKHGKFHLSMKKKYSDGGRALERLPREVVKSHFLVILKTWM